MKTINTDAKGACLLIDPVLLDTPMLLLDVGRETDLKYQTLNTVILLEGILMEYPSLTSGLAKTGANI